MNLWQYVVFVLAGLGVAFAFERFIEREALMGFVCERSVDLSAAQMRRPWRRCRVSG